MIIVQVFMGTKIFLGAMRHCVKWHHQKKPERRFDAMCGGDHTLPTIAMRIRTFCIASSHVPSGCYPG
jgi:hypothetical protein